MPCLKESSPNVPLLILIPSVSTNKMKDTII